MQDAGKKWVGDHADIVIVNYDVVHKFADQLAATPWDLRVMDEIHYCKNPKARRTKATFAIPATRKLALSGTPILNRPVELYGILCDLDPDHWTPKGFFKYVTRYCDAKKIEIGWGKTAWDFSGSSNEAELQQRLRSSIMVRRLKADVLTELPAKQREVIELPAESAEARAAVAEEHEVRRLIFRDRNEELDDLQAKVIMSKASDNDADFDLAVENLRTASQVGFADMSRVRHKVAVAKIPMVIDYVDSRLEADPDLKVILFAHHLDVMAAYKSHWPTAAQVHGGIKDRMAEVSKFQNVPACRVFIGNDAAKEGLNLTRATQVIFAEGDWVPGNLNQKEDRAHRIGQKDKVLVTHLVLEGSVDSSMMKTVIGKQDVIDKIMDRIGEVAGARAVQEVDEVPTVVARARQPSVKITREEIKELAPHLSPEIVRLAHQGMQRLAGVCDGGFKKDDAGFSGVDARIGHSFANQAYLSQKQAVIAVRLCNKYRRQLGEDFVRPLIDALHKEVAK